MIHRRTFLCGLTLGGLMTPLAAEAQQAVKPPRIGLLDYSTSWAPFQQALRDLGHVEDPQRVPRPTIRRRGVAAG